MRKRRDTTNRDLKHDTSLRKFFVLGALCSCHVAWNTVGSAPVDDGRCRQPDHRGKTALATITFIHHPHGPSFAAHGLAANDGHFSPRHSQHKPNTRSNRMTNTRDMCLDCLVAARTVLGMNWRRFSSDWFQSVFTAWRSCVCRFALQRGLTCAHNQRSEMRAQSQQMNIGFPKSHADCECYIDQNHNIRNLSWLYNQTQAQPSTRFLRSRDIVLPSSGLGSVGAFAR